MKALKLYISNFMCHDHSFIDFEEFSIAQIIGKKENSDLISNGVGKTSIFKAIEYVLFNHFDEKFERLIRDDTDSCKIVFDFIIGNEEYRLSRTRTKKGSTDCSLFQRTGSLGSSEEVYHNNNFEPITDEKYWKDISGRRAADTEKDLVKLIKINLKSFRIFVHFIQNDFSGLTTATPEKRKGILKDALNLIVYSKLEKLAKDKSSLLTRDIDKYKTIIENLGNPEENLLSLTNDLKNTELQIVNKDNLLEEVNVKYKLCSDKITKLVTEYNNLENKFSSLLVKEQTVLNEKNKLEISVKEYSSKKSNVAKFAKELVSEISSLKENQVNLIKIDYSQIDILNEDISSNKNKIAQLNLIIQNNTLVLEDLRIPLPNNSVCKHCRQSLSEDHKKICKDKIDREILDCQNNIKNSKKELISCNEKITNHQQIINNITLSKQHLESINNKIAIKNKEIQDKKTLHDEYTNLLNKFIDELKLKNESLEQAREELKLSSLDEAKNIKDIIDLERKNLDLLNDNLLLLHKDKAKSSNIKAVIQHNIEQKNNDKLKKEELENNILDLEKKLGMYPSVIQAFSSTGISNLIVQNVLDDLQEEANLLLSQLKPGLQLSFVVEKTKGDGSEADTLDIIYHVNGRERYYSIISGAMQLSVNFSLKLGLSFLLQKMTGVDIKFLLLDEIDQALDKASVDAFADIVKFFQKDFTILIITHNDRLKDKFAHAILVEQDINMVSRAKVVSSW